MYNKYVSLEKIREYDENIDNDLNISQGMKDNPIIREVCRAGLYLCEQLELLMCPQELILRIQYTAGKISFGRDAWEVHRQVLKEYEMNTLEYEKDISELN
jgi:hypothetical protein